MKNRVYSTTFTFQLFNVVKITKQVIPLLFFLFFFISYSAIVSSQDISRDNYSGTWLDDATWMDNTSPGESNILQNCTIYGEVQHIGNLDFTFGDLIVYDTLVIFGNLILGNNADLIINPGGILIVYGDYISGNQVMVITGGYLVVTGNFSMLGADDQGSFEITSGAVYLLDPTPVIKNDTAYASLNCPDPDDYPVNCGYGNLDDLSASPISTIFNSGTYSIDLSGSATFCQGNYVILSVPNDGTGYQWYKDGDPIGGATLYFYVASESGEYSISFIIGTHVITTSPVTVTVNAIPTIIGTTTGLVCGPGAVTLEALASEGIINWYATPTGGVSLGAGLSFTTPVISANTTYYIDASSNGCTTFSRTAVIATVNSVPSAPVTGVITQPDCNLSTGSVMLSGLPAGNWSLNPGGLTGNTSGSTISGLPSGNYIFTVTNSVGCTSAASSNIVINPQPPLPTLIITDPEAVCSPLTADLTAAAVTEGSTEGLAYSYWSDAAATINYGIPSMAMEGTYYIKAINGSGCYDIKPVTVTVNPVPTITGTYTDILCHGMSSGTIDITVTEGKMPYTFNWVGSGVNKTDEDQTGLDASFYAVIATDANNCESESFFVTITEPPALSGIVTSKTNVSAFGANDGIVVIEATGGTLPYLYKIDVGSYQTFGTFGNLPAGYYTVTIVDNNLCTFEIGVSIGQPKSTLSGSIITKTNVTCSGTPTGSVSVSGSSGVIPYEYKLDEGSYQTSGSFSNLSAGTYVATVRDATLATFNMSFTITQPSVAVGGSVDSQSDVICNGGNTGSITVSGSGGLPPYKYKLDTGSYQDSGDFGSLAIGSYSVTVQDANFCTAIIPVTITGPALLSVTSAVEDVSCPDIADGKISLEITGGTEPYSAIWSDGFTAVNRTDIPSGSYSVVITDLNGCAATHDAVIGNEGSETCLQIQEIITPNNDGFYDTWKIRNIGLFPDAEVHVFNRWGKMVFSTKNISANEWDGTFKGELLPTDSYHYLLYLNDGSEPRSGIVSIIR